MNLQKGFLLFILFNLGCTVAYSQCDVAQIVSANKSTITSSTYQYDGFLIHEVSFIKDDKHNKQSHSEFIAFKKEVYKLAFCTSGFEDSVKVTIYKKNNPQEILAEQVLNASVKQWVFEPLKPGIYTIVYSPSNSPVNAEQKGCIVMLIGFKK